MAKNLNTITSSMISNIKSKNPTIDTSEGSIASDIVIGVPANEFVNLYDTMDTISLSQSPTTANSSALDGLASNIGLVRKSATKAQGIITFFSFNAPLSDITIPAGTYIGTIPSTSGSNIQFMTLNTVVMYTSLGGSYLNPYTGVYEISAAIQATTAGSNGIVGATTITSMQSTISGINGCYNTSPTIDGTDQESDSQLQLRIVTRTKGTVLGTPDGILNEVLSQDGVTDAIVVGSTDNIRSDLGSIDVCIKGTLQTFNVDSFYKNSSTMQDIVLSQQPVYDIISIQGSTSGVISTALYELVSDTSAYGGSIVSQDTIHWLGALSTDVETIYVFYYYNSLVASVQAIFSQSDKKLLNKNLLIKGATDIAIDITCSIKVLPGFDITSVVNTVQNNLATFFSTVSIGEQLQQSDVAGVIINSPGVDDILLPLTVFQSSDSTITRDNFGSLNLPKYSYAVGGTITITVVS